MHRLCSLLTCLLLASSCQEQSSMAPVLDSEGAVQQESLLPVESDTGHAKHRVVRVLVTLDGVPAEGARVLQGGTAIHDYTDADGLVDLELDLELQGEILIIASHPEARLDGYEPPAEGETLTIPLLRYDPSDNPDYVFQHPGTDEKFWTTDYCAHCHISIHDDWFGSEHASSASNLWLQDLYSGVASSLSDQASCESLGGSWRSGLQPGTRAEIERCYLGEGVLPALNDCGEQVSCDDSEQAERFGACADCHAPGINGQLGGRDLLEAVGVEHDFGVHCDVCHKVDEIRPEEPAGVAGRLRITRPSEINDSPGLGEFEPLMFGPFHDVLNPRMGSVQRDHFREAIFCSGCHELDQEALIPGQAVDQERWPSGRFPVHSTYSEWEAGPMNPGAPCQSCHMPPDADVGNAADLGVFSEPSDGELGISNGWWREPGSVRRHVWFGPRSEEQRMLDLAMTLDVVAELEGEELVVEVTTKNVGPGHAVPTGEPLRHLLLLVRADCDGEGMEPAGGDVVPDYGGFIEQRLAGEDWTRWPDASVGEELVVVQESGWRDYAGYGPFGDGRFSPEEKGVRVEQLAGVSVIEGVDSEGRVELSAALPEGARVYRRAAAAQPEEGGEPGDWAGTPGYGFARVLGGEDGARMVPHFMAVDVISDQRLLPQTQWTSQHRFTGDCAQPTLEAQLVYRSAPRALATERAWSLRDQVIATVRGGLE